MESRTQSWYQIHPTSSKAAIEETDTGSKHIHVSKSDLGDGEGDYSLDLEEIYKSNSVIVTFRNKVICSVAFLILMLSLLAYLAFLATMHVQYPSVAALSHFSGPLLTLYIIFGIDIISGAVGIWTSVVKSKTRHWPMTISCAWLTISSLGNVCVAVSMIYEDEVFKKSNAADCAYGINHDECLIYKRIKLCLWCSLIFIGVKIVIVILCRLNYPQAFNWMIGKEVLVDEEIIKENKSSEIARAATLGAFFYDAPDVNRLTARGALGGQVEQPANSQAILVLKKDDFDQEIKGDETEDMKGRSGRRPTLVSMDNAGILSLKRLS